jgi:hypothetical protein
LLSVDSSWVPHRPFTSCFFLALIPCTHSCSVFLKAMAHDDERRSKHRQDVGASSSGLSTKLKKLVKRPRPNSYQKESSPEVSPPRGGTPYETECLRIHSLEIHTNLEIMNYSKEDLMNVMHLCNKLCYSSSKERGTNERFWTFFHQDWYRTVLYLKSSPVVKQQYVDIEYMRKKKDMHCNRVLEACDLHGITNLLQFMHNWNQEIISEFYSTLFYDKKERIFMWMTNGRRFHVRLAQFAQILGLSSQLDIPKKVHSGRVMIPREMTPMYVQDGGFQPPKVEGLLPHFLVLHRMMRRTIALRIGYSEAIPTYERNLLDALMKPVRFDVFEYIVDDIWNIATNPLRSCGFAPYIQFIIESVTQEKFYKDVCHDSLRPAVPNDPRASRAGSSATPSRTTRSGGAPSTPATNSSILKMLRGIFATCRCTDQRLDVMDQRLQIVRRNQEIIHSQRDEPLQEFPDVPIFLPVPDPYGSLTPTKLAAFGIGPTRVSSDDDDEAQADDDEETEDDE